ncbi:MAG: pyridoxal-phosphate dependent enzyme [Bacteroidetes bacterium]|nr:pyridoxal-phosphate dependent enzyme [Bacteroidota bacterium]MDA1121409.1 pyridoxal-phosphate dependent enzyme [Bacteroidota bacterium]
MWKERIDSAYSRIQSEINKTPLEYSYPLSHLSKANVYLKLENYQISGSFKIRGVLNKLLSLETGQIEKGLVACSTGNHGAAFAYALKKFGHQGILFLPTNTSRAKIEALHYYDVDLQFHATDCVITEGYSREYAKTHNKPLIHPYNDMEVLVGQGTIAREVLDQSNFNADVIIVPVGGGGLISGIATYFKEVSPDTEVVGAQPENSAVMFESIKHGHIVDDDNRVTISDATAGGIEKDSITFEICRDMVDYFELINEDDIRKGLKLLIEHHQMIVEGAAALTVAALLKNSSRFKNKNVILILTGKRISNSLLKELF